MRGEIYFVRIPEHKTPKHSFDCGYTHVVIVSSEAGNNSSDIVMACPITTKIKELSCNVKLGWSADYRPSQVLCNQIFTLPKSELKVCNGTLTSEELEKVNNAMLISLGIRR